MSAEKNHTKYCINEQVCKNGVIFPEHISAFNSFIAVRLLVQSESLKTLIS